MSVSAKPANPLSTLGGIVGAACGWGMSHYCGASLWLPGIAVIVLLILFTKTPLKPRWFVGAIAVTGAHLLWFTAAGILAGVWDAVLLDIGMLLAAVVWLWTRPGLPAVCFLAAVQGGALAYNVYLISSVAVGDPSHRALTAHIAFRVLALVALVTGYVAFRKRDAVASGTEEVVAVSS